MNWSRSSSFCITREQQVIFSALLQQEFRRAMCWWLIHGSAEFSPALCSHTKACRWSCIMRLIVSGPERCRSQCRSLILMLNTILDLWGPCAKLCQPGGVPVVMNDEWNAVVRVSLRLESSTRETASLLRLAMLSTRFFSLLSKRLYDIHVTGFDWYLSRKGDSTALQYIIIHVFIAAGQIQKNETKMNEWMNEWCIYIALYCILLYTQSTGGEERESKRQSSGWGLLGGHDWQGPVGGNLVRTPGLHPYSLREMPWDL